MQIPSPSPHPSSGVVGTNSPLILLMPELGLLYILSSSDPLCGDKRQKTKDSVVK